MHYWFDLDTVKVPLSQSTLKRAKYNFKSLKSCYAGLTTLNQQKFAKKITNVKGKNPGDVWSIGTQPFHGEHFATFPEKLVERLIKVACPPYICKKCGLPANDLISCNCRAGFVKGIDGLSHKISLSFKKRTIAVLGSGLDICYPKEHKKLFKEIEKNGALISEYPLGTKPYSFNFPLRNRIIAGISLGVLVVEAKEKSGSLITANFALDFGREIFAIPGSIFSQNTKGTHKLIKEGAKLVEKGEDILEAFDIKKAIIKEKKIKPKNEEEKKILDLLKESPLTFDEIFKKTKIEVSKLNSTLLLMEIEKKIKKSGNLYKINQ